MDTAEVLVVGGGPAGLSAAITLSSEGRSVILLEKHSHVGGQAGTSSLIENVPPFAAGFSGQHFTDESCRQCHKFGVRIEYHTEAQAIIPGCGAFTLMTNHGAYQGRVVLLALGLQNRWLGVPGEELPQVHHGMNMSALADVTGRHVVLIGGGNSAGQAALYYLDRGAEVTIIARRPLKETMSSYLTNRLNHRAYVVYGKVGGFIQQGSGKVATVVNGFADRLWDADCVHIFIGQVPGTEWINGLIAKDERGYILTGDHYETSVPGIFAVGDVTHDAVRRVACAVGDGNRVVPAIHEFLGQDFECYHVA